MDQRRFGSLDGLRSLSILAVIWHHTAAPAFPGRLQEAGTNGVTLFFAISGFLITSLLLRERRASGGISLRHFYWRRAVRIFPLYYATLALYVCLVALVERDPVAANGFWNNLKFFATYTSNLFVPLDESRTIFYFAWSLATEEQFYLIWPPLLVLLGREWLAAGLLLVLVAVTLAGEAMGIQGFHAVPVPILLASALAIALHRPGGFAVLSRVLTGYWMPVVWGLLLAAALWAGGRFGLWVGVLAAFFVVSCVVSGRHALSGLLEWRFAVHVGSVSYGMYMLHMLCKAGAVKVLARLGIEGPLPTFLLTALLAIVLASISFRFFESRLLKLKPPQFLSRTATPV